MPLYSEEVQDILGRIPGKILHIGLAIIFGILLMVMIGSYFIQYPQVISCPLSLTTINPPIALYANTTGKIEHLFVEENEKVIPGQVIATIMNTARYEDIQTLEKTLENLSGIIDWDSIVQNNPINQHLVLGELQTYYIKLCKSWINYHNYLKQNHIPIKTALLKSQISKQNEIYESLKQQRIFMQKDFSLTEKQFQRDSTFFYKYRDAISIVEYEKQMQNYLQKKTAYLNFCSSIKDSENNILKLNESLIDLQIQYEKELEAFRLELDEAYRLIIESYNQWKEKYIISSPIGGILTYTSPWTEKQTINSGEKIVTIVPEEKTQIIGKATIDMNGIGKVRVGQQVNIKLNGFPYMEFGYLKGRISKISLVPEKKQGYIADIVLTEGMQSSYKEPLNFIQEMEGIADIITKDESLLSRFLQPLKYKLNE